MPARTVEAWRVLLPALERWRRVASLALRRAVLLALLKGPAARSFAAAAEQGRRAARVAAAESGRRLLPAKLARLAAAKQARSPWFRLRRRRPPPLRRRRHRARRRPY